MSDHDATTPPPASETVLSLCGAQALAALIANDGIVGIEVDPPTDTLFLRYDPRRTQRERVEAVAEALQPALRRTQRQAQHAQIHGTSGRLDAKPYLFPSTTVQRIGRINIEQAASATLPAASMAERAPSTALPQPPTPDTVAGEPAAGHAEHAFLLQVVQPGLVGLMDGSVSTLAPLFATAYATHNHTAALLVGLASAVGAGISMGFAEALSDTGILTGRGLPWVRGGITGGMTFVGGLGHSLPFLIPNLHAALILAYFVVGIELIAISLIRTKYFQAPFVFSALQVIVGGALVFAAGVLIGSA